MIAHRSIRSLSAPGKPLCTPAEYSLPQAGLTAPGRTLNTTIPAVEVPTSAEAIDACKYLRTPVVGLSAPGGIHCSHPGLDCSQPGLHCSQPGLYCSQTGFHCSQAGLHCSQGGLHSSQAGRSTTARRQALLSGRSLLTSRPRLCSGHSLVHLRELCQSRLSHHAYFL